VSHVAHLRARFRSRLGALVLAAAFAGALALPAFGSEASRQPPEALGDDYRLLAASLVHEIKHGDPAERAAWFDPAGTHLLLEPGFAYEGFELTGLAVSELTPTPSPGGGHRSSGVLFLADDLGRRAEVQYYANVGISPQGLVFHESFAAPIYRPRPEMEMYILERNTFEMGVRGGNPGYGQLRDFARMMRIPERDRTVTPRERVILIFSKDRMDPGARMEVVATEQSHAAAGAASVLPVRYADYDGWRVAVLGGKFGFSPMRRFHVHVLHTAPGCETVRAARFEIR
jgi:hypothetical protein